MLKFRKGVSFKCIKTVVDRKYSLNVYPLLKSSKDKNISEYYRSTTIFLSLKTHTFMEF